MIGGAPPFSGDTAGVLLSRHETAVRPRLTAHAPVKRSATLADDVIATMMAKRPADRFQSYDELIAALDRASTRRTRPAGMAVRGVAAFLDLMGSLIIAAPLMLLMPDLANNVWVLAVWALLYPLALARWGTTPGRALFALEVISERGNGRVGYLQAQLRFLVEYGVIVAGAALTEAGRVSGNRWIEDGAAVPALLGLAYVGVTVLMTATRSVDKLTLWDQVSSTRTCYRRPPDTRAG
jgi:hypothetical protein